MSKNKKSFLTHDNENWLFNFIQKGKILDVQSAVILFAVIFLLFYIALKEIFFPRISQIYNYLAIAISAIIIGLVGLIAILRKEIPGPVAGVTIKGNCAIIAGLVVILFFWGLVIAGIIVWFFE